ncbi:MAG: AAA family ATPase [Sphaerospermopsis kisseleviana]|uniref:AAA family ATPase n=1 Tax=unclassified Sphaerospermopsis TaxID=2646443 RepID=UPI001680A632|nr:MULTISPECIES: AAA family ATPase [unclassified Sphaerospermopsis]MBD2133030.1 ATP-binding protein [Sphaerospermopsis sp. FACHB-1094]MBD2145793.1 ATP-binding protein [Sphaerospermopsis sp. FACHB-1194]
MKINQLSYYDRELEWQLEPITFSDLTLLVGISGVGKTQILQSIIALQNIANGKSLNGVKWKIYFTANNGIEYYWSGEFETQQISLTLLDDEENKENKFRIISEVLLANDKKIIQRDHQEIKFHDLTLPKLSPFQSAVAILSEEEDISPVQDSFNSIIYSDQSISINTFHFIKYAPLTKKYSSLNLDDLQESNLPTQIKLALAYNHFPEVFNQIKDNFRDIFVQVEDIKLEPDQDEDLPKVIAEYPLVNIQEKGVNRWINQHQISSGMMRTLMHISELYLSAEGTVILIDEFENSLGVNCIDILTELILENRNLQFIITSHHPYIINNIGMEHWKIITRKGGVVTARDAKDLNLGKSRHQAFMQLMNLEEYKEGITA